MDQVAIFSDKKAAEKPKKKVDADYERRLKELKEKYGE